MDEPRVTQVISSVLRPNRWMVDEWYLARGRILHTALEYLDCGELDDTTIDPEISGRVQSYLKFKSDTGFTPTLIEKRFHHPAHKYTGKIDRLGELDGRVILVDIKSGLFDPADQIQAGAYWGLLLTENIHPYKVFDLYLSTEKYKLLEVPTPRIHFNTFLAALTVYRWRKEHE